MRYFDAHCHVQFDAYDADRAEVLARMREAEIGGLVVGCDLKSSRAAVELVRAENGRRAAGAPGDSAIDLYASIGLHPNDVLLEEFDAAAFDELATQPEVIAIGECGLDFYRPEDLERARSKQRDLFEQQIELAVKHDKPLVVHSRPSKGSQDAYRDTIDIFKSKKREHGNKLRGDMHFFVGGIDEAREFIDLGFTLSYTAVITFARDYDDVIRFAPLRSLLSETDSPFVAPAPNRGKRNEPTAVRDVVRTLAEIRSENEEKVRETILENTRQIFSISL